LSHRRGRVVAEFFRVRLDEAIAEVERELGIRRTFYADRVRHRQMSRLRADSQMNRLEAARDFLLELRGIRGGDHEHTPGGHGAVAG
jgi:hypothetical protein